MVVIWHRPKLCLKPFCITGECGLCWTCLYKRRGSGTWSSAVRLHWRGSGTWSSEVRLERKWDLVKWSETALERKWDLVKWSECTAGTTLVQRVFCVTCAVYSSQGWDWVKVPKAGSQPNSRGVRGHAIPPHPPPRNILKSRCKSGAFWRLGLLRIFYFFSSIFFPRKWSWSTTDCNSAPRKSASTRNNLTPEFWRRQSACSGSCSTRQRFAYYQVTLL